MRFTPAQFIALGFVAGLIWLLVAFKLVGLAVFFFLISGWFLLCAARPKMRASNRKVLEPTSARTCVIEAGYALIIGLIILIIGLKLRH